MDRDKRWERIQLAYDGLVGGRGEATTTEKVVETVQKRYAAGETDEFLKPIIVNKDGIIKGTPQYSSTFFGSAEASFSDKDTLLFIDYRSDRMRQIVETFGLKRNFDTDLPHPEGLVRSHARLATQFGPLWTAISGLLNNLPSPSPPMRTSSRCQYCQYSSESLLRAALSVPKLQYVLHALQNITTMTQYNAAFPFPQLYPPVSHKQVLAEALADQGVTQFHCAGSSSQQLTPRA